MASAVLSLVKNKVDLLRGTELEKKVKEATSNENWGASSTLKNEIARATYDYEGFREVMPLIWKRMQDEGRNWRIVFKSMVLLEHLLRLGSERAVQDAKDRVFQVRQLQDFQYIDENGKDQGTGVREQAKLLVGLLQDDDKLKEARENARSVLSKVKGASSMGAYGGFGSESGFGGSYGGSSGGGGGGGYDEDSRFGRSSWDAPDSRDSGSRSSTTKRTTELENDIKKKDKEREKEKEKKKKEKEHHHHHSSHKKKTKEESEEEEESPQEKKSSKKSSSKSKKHESDEEEAPDSDDDKHRSKKSEKGKKEEKKSSKIKVQLSDKPASSSSGASKGAKISAPKGDAGFSADFDANFPDDSHVATSSNRGQSSFNADFEADFDALAGSGPSRQPARQQHDDFGSFASAPAPAPQFSRPAQSMPFDSFGFQSAPAPAARFDNFDMMDQPVHAAPSAPAGFDLISAVSHAPAAPQNKGKPQQQQHQSNDGFLDFESANTPAQPAAAAPKPAAKKDVWDMGGLVKLDNLSVSEPAKATAAAKPAASSGPFIDLGPSRRAGGGSSAAPSSSAGGYGFDIGFGPANNAAPNNFGGMNMGFGGPAMPPQMGGYGAPMGGMGGYGAPPPMGYGMGGYGMGMPPGPMGGMNMGYGAPAGRGRGMPPSGFM